MDHAASRFLQVDDPLFEFLREEVLERILGQRPKDPAFSIQPLGRGNTFWIYRYREAASGCDLVCKFYGGKPLFDGWIGDRNLRGFLMQRELDNLARLRSIGLDRPPHQVVRPLAASREINCVLVQEFAPGTDLETDLQAAARDGAGEGLRDRLERLARFLADLHSRSRTRSPLAAADLVDRLSGLARGLASRGTISSEQEARLLALAERWDREGALGRGFQTWIHGDASPSHFLFDAERGLTAIDLEGLREGDPAEDVGRVTAEIRQAFFRHRGERITAEPYLRDFYAAYRENLPPGAETWEDFEQRARFFAGLFLASIGRNLQLDLAYRRRLIEDAAVGLGG